MIKWGLVGVGDISNKRVAPAIRAQADSELVAAYGPIPEEMDRFVAKNPVKKAYSKLEDMLTDEEIDAVYVATPIFVHYSIALQAIHSGKHVLVEKPMAMTNDECESLIRAAKEKNVKLGVAYFRRFFPKLAEVKRLIAEGCIGDLVSARITFHSWYNPEKSDPKYWRVIKERSGGGPLWDMGCHKFDLMQELLGEVKSVQALMDTLTHEYEVEDSCTVLMQMKNGMHCQASFNWNSKVWADEFVILGTEGKIRMIPGDGDGIELELPPKAIKGMGKEVTSVIKPNNGNVHFPVIDDFAHAIVEDRAPRISGEVGYQTNRILAAIEESCVSGKKILL